MMALPLSATEQEGSSVQKLSSMPKVAVSEEKKSVFNRSSGGRDNKRWLLIGGGLVLLVAVPMGLWLYQLQETGVMPDGRGGSGTGVPAVVVEGGFLQVGEEVIYQRDFEYEVSMYPVIPGVNIEEIVRNKLIEDSVVIQAGAAAGWTVLDETVFNSMEKNYEKRMKLVADLKERIQEDSIANISGSVVSVWFMNTRPGPIGYEAGKELAERKIKAVHERVKSGEISMEQAGAVLAADSSLAQVDAAYDSNAFFPFSHEMNKKIVFDDEFDAYLKTLPPGEISEIVLVQAYEGNDQTVKKDAVYMFGTVTSRRAADGMATYLEWLAQQKQIYAVQE